MKRRLWLLALVTALVIACSGAAPAQPQNPQVALALCPCQCRTNERYS